MAFRWEGAALVSQLNGPGSIKIKEACIIRPGSIKIKESCQKNIYIIHRPASIKTKETCQRKGIYDKTLFNKDFREFGQRKKKQDLLQYYKIIYKINPDANFFITTDRQT